MANEPVAPVAAEAAPATNEAIIGTPKPSAATVPVTEDAPITPVAKRKIKWGDTEKEVSFDEAVQLAQKAFGIEGKARESALKAEQAEKFMHMLTNDPKGFAKQAKAVGLDPQKLATEILYENIRINSLTPEQRELEEYKAKEAEAAEAKKDAEAAEKAKVIDAKTREWTTNFEKQLETALAKSQMPKTRLALALTAQYIDAGLKNKKEFTVEQVLPMVLRDLKNIHNETMGKLDGDDLLNYIGEEIGNKIAAARVARYKKGQVTPVVAAPVRTPSDRKIDMSKLKGKAYWNELRRQKSEAGIGTFPGQE